LLQLTLGVLGALPVVGAAVLLRRRGSTDIPTGAVVSTPSAAANASTPRIATARAGAPAGAATPIALSIELRPPQVGVGETMRVRTRAPGTASATVEFSGNAHPLLVLPDGALWGLVAASLDQAPGPQTVTITARSATGAVIGTASLPTAVVPVVRPVDYLQTTEAEAAVLTFDAQTREDMLRAQQFATFDPAPRWTGLFILPAEHGEVTTHFGQGRSINGGPVGGFHSGTDFAEDEGVPVHAAAPGRVTWAGAMPIRGNAVILDHGGGVKSGYHHLSAIAVTPGDAVIPAGTVIGAVGSTGFATGPHLHWEVTVWGVDVDGVTWLTEPFGP
jgi:murein DD-endopeptidase MepM/ murein hydrolase activator NlpD